jgi:hypothetical protein
MPASVIKTCCSDLTLFVQLLGDIAVSSNDHPWLDNAIIRSLGRGDRDNDTLRPVLAHALKYGTYWQSAPWEHPTRSQKDHGKLIRVL